MLSKKLFCIVTIFLFSTMFLISSDEDADYVYGKVTFEQVLKDSPDWKSLKDEHMPDMKTIEYLQNVLAQVKIEVYFGHWCSDSVENLPKFFKILELTGNDLFTAEYWSIPRTEKDKKRDSVNGREIKKIPTFVVYVEGVEAGEIVENPKETLESDLAEIISKLYKEE